MRKPSWILELYDKTHAKFKDKQKKEGLWKTVAATRNRTLSRSGSRLIDQIWKAHSCSQDHRKTDLVEGQFQFSARSHQKEGSV